MLIVLWIEVLSELFIVGLDVDVSKELAEGCKLGAFELSKGLVSTAVVGTFVGATVGFIFVGTFVGYGVGGGVANN